MKLKETINVFSENGIFATLRGLDTNNKLKFLTDDNKKTIDYEYYLSVSGNKNISPFYRVMLEAEENEDIESAILEMAKVIYNKYAENWKYIYNAMMAEYDPIENYNGVEDSTIKNNINVTNKSNNKYFGVNSALGKDANANESNTTGSEDDNYTTNHVEKHGNLGVTTSQQMIESELVLREKKMLDIIYRDVDEILCSSLF